MTSSHDPDKWGWKELASTVVDDHHRDGQSATFVFSGAQVGIYMGALGVKDSDSPTLTVVGERLSKRALRKWFWENFAGVDNPADVPSGTVVWTAYDEDSKQSYVGLGGIIRQPEDK
jgi:hypothetical protein